MLEALSLAAGLSWASGLRLYLTIFVAGVFERMGLVHLPDTLAVLVSPWVIGVAGVSGRRRISRRQDPRLRFALGRHPHADPHSGRRRAGSRRRSVTPIRRSSPIAALAGGTLAGASHLAKAGTRALINLSPEPVSNWARLARPRTSACSAACTLALFVPLLFLRARDRVSSCFAGWALPRLVRGVHGGVSRHGEAHGVERRAVSRLGRLRSKHD